MPPRRKAADLADSNETNGSHGADNVRVAVAESPWPADLLDTGERLSTQAQGLANWGAARHGARVVLTWRQKAALLLLLVLCIAVAIWNPLVVQRDGLIASFALVTAIYFLSGLHKAWMLTRVAGIHGYVPHNTPIADADLPPYTVLVPLQREQAMLPVLVRRLSALDYPADRLQVLLLVEADDEDTFEALGYVHTPSNFQVLIVPPGEPRTKPRALNFGLAHATGTYLVVYDAEDNPDPDQLRKAAAAFAQLPPKVVCLQARLDFYNRRQTLLTRLFTLDYLLWYTMVLPGLTQRSAFIPLGGTSNHFRRVPLRRLGGWDPYNVTEDCDIGARIARARLQVAMLDSVTGEEAVTLPRPWTRQRSRWIKGYMQTYLVHMRRPIKLLREMGPVGWIDFNLLLGGTVFVLLVNPIMWLLTILYIAGAGTPVDAWIQSLFPTWIYYPAILCQVVGNFLFIYINVYASVRYKYYDLTPYTLLGPLYWVLMSGAAWRALGSLVVHPFHWNKTAHGVSIPLARPQPGYASAAALQWWLAASRRVGEAPALSYVLPAYNEEGNIEHTVRACLAVLDRICPAAEVIIIDDGSSDRTGLIINELAQRDPRVQPLHQPHQGYGGAVLAGISAARGHLVCYMDSDGQFDPVDLEELINAQLESPNAVVLGYRQQRADSPIRLLNAWTWKQTIRMWLGLRGIRDIDCGFKLFPTHVIQASSVSSRGAMVSADLLTRLRRMHVKVVQVPVRHRPRRFGQATGANLRVILRALAELRSVRRNLRRWQPPVVVAADWASDQGGPRAAVVAIQEAQATAKLVTPRARAQLLSYVSEARVMLFISAAVLLVNLWQAIQAPASVQEGVSWQSLRALSSGYHLYTTLYSTQPPIFLRSTYPFFLAFGHSLLGARLAMIVFALVGLLAASNAGRVIAGRWAGVIAAGVLALNPLFFAAAHTLDPAVLSLPLALIAVALAAAAMRDTALGVATPAGQFVLALTSGLALGLSVLTSLSAVAVVLPVLLYLVTPLWGKSTGTGVSRTQAIINVFVCLVVGVSTLVVVMLATNADFGTIAKQVLYPRLAASANQSNGAAGIWSQIASLPSAVGLAALGAVGLLSLVVALWRRAWAGLGLGVWGIGALIALALASPAQDLDLLMIVGPLILLVGLLWTWLAEEAAGRRRTWRRRLARISLAVAVVAMAGVGVLSWQEFVFAQSAAPANEAQLVSALQAATKPGNLVVTDAPQIAAVADRSVPPELVDIQASSASGTLTLSYLESIITTEHVQAVLLTSNQLANVTGFQSWLDANARQIEDLGSGQELYVLW
jgi:cellulose synthase/poly-beta-1,6-N-acetylglucosamine synthase-like glycosyltransferase/4-amino-4-deoxy-L-arabinose transferase-like glycosyltransferase